MLLLYITLVKKIKKNIYLKLFPVPRHCFVLIKVMAKFLKSINIDVFCYFWQNTALFYWSVSGV
jgi:hypothetical protein